VTTQDADATLFSIVMDLGDWLRIDGTMDNELHNLQDKCRERPPDRQDPYWVGLTDLAMSIRQAGWDQISDWPSTEGVQRWPVRFGRPAAITLAARQWGFVVSALRRWADVTESIRQSDETANSRRILTLVREELSRQGLAVVPAVRPDW
jgi:hypothetical protein